MGSILYCLEIKACANHQSDHWRQGNWRPVMSVMRLKITLQILALTWLLRHEFEDMCPCGGSFELKLLTVGQVLELAVSWQSWWPLPNSSTSPQISIPPTAISLTHIFNRVIETGYIPNDWKKARIMPIYKGDSKLDPVNYRPISVLSTIAKVIEKAAFNQAYQYVVDTTDNWYRNIDNGLMNVNLFFDLKRRLIP